MLRSPLATAHVAVAQVRGTTTYRALGKKDSLVEKNDFKTELSVKERVVHRLPNYIGRSDPS